MQPLLTIAIPSNNRTELLGEAIESILADSVFRERCEISISDNSSSEVTQKFINTRFSGDPQIKYLRSLDSPSLDENVSKVVGISRGKYVWFFGDDDLLVEGALDGLLCYLEKNSPDILILNSSSFSGKDVIETLRFPESEAKVYGVFDDEKFLSELGGYLTYVGCIVIQRELWISFYRKEMVGTYFSHIDVICRAKIGHIAHFYPKPCISMRLHSQTWTAKHFEIWNLHYPAVIWQLNGYSSQAKAAVIPKRPINSLRRILASRAYGRFNLEIFRAVLWRHPDSGLLIKIFGFLIALFPRHIFRWLYIAFIYIGRSRHSRGFSPSLALAQLGNPKK